MNFSTQLTTEQLPEDRFIKAVEFRPGSSVVHHIISNPLGGLAPGNDATVFEDGYYQPLNKGAEITFEMHYHKEAGPGTGVWDRSSAAIKFYPKGEQPKHQIRIAMLGDQSFVIPAGDPNYSVSLEEIFDEDIEVISFTPHMHLRGKSAHYKVKRPDHPIESVLDVPFYDFNWQTNYEFANPPVLPAGSKVLLTMAWDNSAENPSNPDPTRDVRFGEPTTDEMMFGFMRYALLEEPDSYSMSIEDLNEYEGTYAFDDKNHYEVKLTGEYLTAVGTMSPTFPIAPVTEDQFEYSMVNLKVDFERNDLSEIVAMVITFQGEANRAMKVTVD